MKSSEVTVTPARLTSSAKVRPSVAATPELKEEDEEQTNHVEEPVEEDEGVTPKKPKTQAAKRPTVRSGLKIKLSNGHHEVVSIYSSFQNS